MFKRIRDAAEQIVSLAPASQAYKAHSLPHVGIDEGLRSKRVWKLVRALVGQDLASGGVTLWNEMYLNPDGSIAPIPEIADHRKGLKIVRSNPALRRMRCLDADIVGMILAHLYTEKHFVVLSSDLGTQADGLRGILSTDVAPALAKSDLLGITLLLKRGRTPEPEFIRRAYELFTTRSWLPGFRELEF